MHAHTTRRIQYTYAFPVAHTNMSYYYFFGGGVWGRLGWSLLGCCYPNWIKYDDWTARKMSPRWNKAATSAPMNRHKRQDLKRCLGKLSPHLLPLSWRKFSVCSLVLFHIMFHFLFFVMFKTAGCGQILFQYSNIIVFLFEVRRSKLFFFLLVVKFHCCCSASSAQEVYFSTWMKHREVWCGLHREHVTVCIE